MMKPRSLILILMIVSTGQAQAGLWSRISNALSRLPGIGNIVDDYTNDKAHAKVNDKIADLRDKALKCSPLEEDNGLTVKHLMKIKPSFPSWRKLEKLQSVAKKAEKSAEKRSDNDKVRHCYAGCFISKDLSYSSARLVAFMKELKDASDCKSSTHFEMEDYYATIAGAKMSRWVKCDDFCGTRANSSRTGSQMMRAARRLSNEHRAQKVKAQSESRRLWRDVMQ